MAAAVLWGTTGTAQAFTPDDSSPLAVGALRIAIGGGALLVYAWTRRGSRSLGDCLAARVWPTTLLGVLGVAAYQVLFFSAVSITGVAVGTLAAIGSAPILAGVAGLTIGERLGSRWMAATGVLVAGLALLTLAGSGARTVPIGVVAAIGAGGAYAVYTVVGRALLARGLHGDAVVAVLFAGAAVPLLVTAALRAPFGWLDDAAAVVPVVWLGLGATALPYWLWTRGLAHLPADRAGTLSIAEPATAALLGTLLLGERLTLAAMAGIAIILVGMWLAATPGRRARRRRRRGRRGPVERPSAADHSGVMRRRRQR